MVEAVAIYENRQFFSLELYADTNNGGFLTAVYFLYLHLPEKGKSPPRMC